MLFGRSLYGGALYPRQVTAGGSVAATCSVQVSEVANRKLAGGTAGLAVAAQAEAIRNVIPTSPVVSCVAGVSGSGKADFSGFADAQTTAAVAGLPRCDFLSGGEVAAGMDGAVSVERWVRVLIPSKSVGTALGEAEGAAYVYAGAVAVSAKAFPFGTHWFIGRGVTDATATPAADVSRTLSVHGESITAALPAGDAQTELFGRGDSASASALLDSDPVIESDGIMYRFGRGEAIPAASPSADSYVYSVMLGVGFAYPVGNGQSQRAASGQAVATASGVADTERVVPFEGAVTVGAIATGEVRAKIHVLGRAQTYTTADVASAHVFYLASSRAVVESEATAESLRVALETRPGAGGGSAVAAPAAASTNAMASGTSAECATGGAAKAVVRYAIFGSGSGLALPAATSALHPKIPASGEATGEAFAEGTNAVGNPDQPLSARAVSVPSGGRTIVVQSSTRTVGVGGTNRRLAA